MEYSWFLKIGMKLQTNTLLCLKCMYFNFSYLLSHNFELCFFFLCLGYMFKQITKAKVLINKNKLVL